MSKSIDISWNWEEIFVAYCTKEISFQKLSDEYRAKHKGDGPATGTIFNRSKLEDWKARKKKWIANRQDGKLQEIKKTELAEFRKGISVINEIIEKMGNDILAKLNIPKTIVKVEGIDEPLSISRYNASFADLDRAIRLKKLLIDGNDPIKNITLTLNYPVINMSEEDKRDYKEFVEKDFREKAIDVEFELVEPGDEESPEKE